MFSTQGGGATSDDVLYLRPETAQGIFVNYNNVLNTSRQKFHLHCSDRKGVQKRDRCQTIHIPNA